MEEIIKLLIGTAVLLLGVPLGTLLAKQTKEELKDGQKWFNILIIASLIGGLTGLIIGNDFILFSFLFITILTLRSLREQKKKKSRR